MQSSMTSSTQPASWRPLRRRLGSFPLVRIEIALIRGFVLGGIATVVGDFLGKGQHGCSGALDGDGRWR